MRVKLKTDNAKLRQKITERKQAEEALRNIEQEKLAILNSMSEHTIYQDTEHRILWANKAAAGSVALSIEQLVGRHCYEIWPKRNKPCVGCPVAKARKTGKPQKAEITTPDGRVWFIRGYPVRDASENLVGMVEVTLEVTESKQAEDALQAEKNKLQSLIDAMEDGLSIQDTDYNIIYQNEPSRIAAGGGYYLGKKCYRAYEGKERVCRGCPVKMAFKDGKSHTSERMVVLPSGEVIFWENTASPIRDASGKIVSCLEITRNITERKQAEEALADEATRRRILVDQSRDGIVVLDENGKVYESNQRFAEMLGYSLEEVRELHVWDWDTQWTREQLLEMVQSIDAAGDHFVTYHRRKDGTVCDVEISTNGAVCAGHKLVFCVCRDITERRQAEDALQAEKNKLQSIVGAMEDGLTIQDKDYNIIYQNETVKLIFGDRVGEKCYRVYEGKEKVCEGCPVEKAFKDGKSHTSERRVVTPSGEVTFWENTANPIRDARGKVVSCLEVDRDITERKQAEATLRESEEFSSSLLTNAPNPVLVISQDTSVRYVNPAFEKLSGFSSAEVIGRKTPYLWWTEETLKKTSGDLEKAMRKGAVRIEELFNKKNGERFWVEITSTPLRKDGEYKYYLANWVDITERKQAEEALRESREKYQKMFESVTEGISVVDLKGVIIETNQRAVEMHGFASRNELPGKSALELVAPRDHERIAKNMRKALKQGIVIGEEYTLLKADGTEFPGELSTSVIRDASGKPVAHITIARDITERKGMEEALRESEERFRSIVVNSQAGIMILDDAYRLVYANDELYRISGYSPKDVIGQDFRKFLDEESKKLVAERYIRRQRGEEVPPRYEFNIIKKDGQKRRVEISSAVIKDSAGEVRTIAQILDITERKQAEEALQTEKNKLQSVVDAMEYGLTIQDRDYNIIYEGTLQRTIFGDHVGEKCYRVYEGKERVCRGCPVKKAFKDGKSHTAERRTLAPSGEVIFWENTASPIRDAKGKIVSCLEIARNITERKQAEEELQAEKNKLQSLVGAMEDGLSIRDRDYNIIYQNEVSRRHFGDHLGEKCYRVYEGKEKICDGCPIEQAFKDGKSHTMERRVVLPSGEVVFWETTSSPIRDAKGKIVSCLELARDITERKQAEEALRESQKFSSSLLESSPNPISVINPDTSVRYVNPAFEKLTGFTLAEIAGKKAPYPWWPEGKRAEITVAFKKTMARGGRRTERNFQKKNGERFWVALNSAPVMHNGKPIYFLLSWLDITERKQAEEALRESQKFSSSLLERSPNPITVVNLDTSIRYVNPAFEKLTGFTSAEIVGRKAPYPWWPEGKRARILASFKYAVEHGSRKTERNFEKKNGERFWVALNSAPVMHEGKAIYLIINWLDITERKRAEEKLQESEDYLKTIFDASTGGILIIEPETHKIVDANPAIIKMFGVDRKKIIGHVCYQFVCPQELGQCPVTDLKQRVDTKECVFLNAEGEEIPALKSVVPITRHGREYLLELIFDIAERKRAEEKEKQLQQELYLARRLASVGELAAGVAHEINNPLTGVLGFSQRLMRKSTNEELSRDLEIIHSEARRAAEVVRNLLTFARRRQPKKEYSDINDIVQKTLELRGYALQTSNIEVVTDLAPSLPQIMVDFSQMQEVFLNIILNAEQAMNEAHGKGKLIIKTRQIKDYVRVSLADDGPGIAPESLYKVFDPFFTTRAEGGGTGLGLSACHGIVTEHGGRIYVRSKPGKGATFFVELPLSPVETTVGR